MPEYLQLGHGGVLEAQESGHNKAPLLGHSEGDRYDYNIRNGHSLRV